MGRDGVQEWLRTGQFADRAGITVRTGRYYYTPCCIAQGGSHEADRCAIACESGLRIPPVAAQALTRTGA